MLYGILGIFALILAVPKAGNAYTSPGPDGITWQVVAAALMGSLFYSRRLISWIRSVLTSGNRCAAGFLFASCYALVVTPVVYTLFETHPLPRFSDLFLVGIVLTAYLFTWHGAVYLLAIATMVSAWVLPPDGSFAVGQPEDWYRIFSFTAPGAVPPPQHFKPNKA